MSRKKEPIVRRSAAELETLSAEGKTKTKTDWRAAANKQIPDGGDPDDAMERVDWATTELPMPKRNEHTNLRLDADVSPYSVRPDGAHHQWRKVPRRELSIALVADERFCWVTGRIEAS